MRAVCLLICMVLARNAASRIVRPQFYADKLIVQPQDYIEQNEQHEQQHQMHHHHHPRPDNSQSSQESKERVPFDDTNDYLQTTSPMNAWNSALFSAVISQTEHRPAYNDLIEWHGTTSNFPDTNQKNSEMSSIFYDAFVTTKRMNEKEKKRFHEAYRTSVQASNKDVQLTAPQLLKKHEYQVEEHTVKTDDGYILTMFRIPPKNQQQQQEQQQQEQQQQEHQQQEHQQQEHQQQEHQQDQQQEQGHGQHQLQQGQQEQHQGQQQQEQQQQQQQDQQQQQQDQQQQQQDQQQQDQQQNDQSEEQQEQSQEQQSSEVQKAPVVFLMHGLLGSADDWLLMGPGKALAYLLADAGFDVWLGNARGNKYSRRHVSKHHAQPDFWQFTTDEIALHDLPAMIDFTLNKTKQDKLVYVGHSQGATAFFALASTRPEYNEKIVMMHAIAPMVYMNNARSPLLRMIGATDQLFGGLEDNLLGNGEFQPNKALIHLAGGNMCEYQIGCPEVCSNVAFVMAGINPENVDVKLVPVIMGHLPAGASVRQVRHLAQTIASNEFRKFDFGSDINEKVYGEQQPPKYDMTNVQVPVSLYYSEDDLLAHPKDVDRLRQELPNVTDSNKVVKKQFTHMDFQFSKMAPEVVYQRLIKSIEQMKSDSL